MKNISLAWVFLVVFPSLVGVQAQENFPVNGVVSKYQGLHAFINATIHIDAITTIKRGVMLVKDERILSVGNNETIPINAIIHNLEGAHVYPSFIDPYTTYGQASVVAQ